MATAQNNSRRKPARTFGALLAVLAVMAVGLLAFVCIRATGGTLVYALDDAYIHLAMGRTLAESGVWGLNAQTPGAASSSPLWTLLLAGMALTFGPQTWLPLALNLAAAGALALAAEFWLRQLRLRRSWRAAAVAAIIVIGPVGPLAMTGMEHVAHPAAVLLLVTLALRRNAPGPVALGFSAALATGLRYESAFVAAALALVLVVRHDWRRAVALFVGPTVVVSVVGVLQTAAGQGFLPNSLIVKAASVSLSGLGDWVRWKAFGAMEHAFEAPVVAVPLLALFLAWAAASQVRRDDETPVEVRFALEAAAALALAMLLQITLASTGWYHRYEAYLLIWGTLGVVAGARAWQVVGGDLLPRARTGGVAAVGIASVGLLLLFALGTRIQAWQTAPDACLDIASQHAEMARFVQRYYDDVPLVVNDVGYVSYVSEGPILDLGGLASHDVAKARSAGEFDAEWVAREAQRRGIKIGINYALDVVPDSWDEVASWHTGADTVAGSDTVNFYAVDPSISDELLSNLREFESTLHPRVSVEYHLAAGSDQEASRPVVRRRGVR